MYKRLCCLLVMIVILLSEHGVGFAADWRYQTSISSPQPQTDGYIDRETIIYLEKENIYELWIKLENCEKKENKSTAFFRVQYNDEEQKFRNIKRVYVVGNNPPIVSTREPSVWFNANGNVIITKAVNFIAANPVFVQTRNE